MSKLFTIASVAMVVALSACSSSGGGGGNGGGGLFGGGGAPDQGQQQGGGVQNATFVLACGSAVQTPNAQNAELCIDFFTTPNTGFTADKARTICEQQQQQELNNQQCPTNGVISTCGLNKSGVIVLSHFYNDQNGTDLQSFANECQKNGGKILK